MRWVLAVVVLLLTGCGVAGTLPPAGASPPAAPSASASNASPSPSRTPPATASRPASASPIPSPTPTSTPSPTRTVAPAPPRDRRTGSALAVPFTVDGLPVVSKRHPINASFRRASSTAPFGLTVPTQRALSRMTAAARRQGVRLVVRSGYRSYAQQAQILAAKIREYGDEALARRYNAAPGRSEHQTGLAVDLWDGVTWGVGVRNTRTGRWLWANAWRYGFVLRYPNGKERITGYAFEPWHYRFVGTSHAKAFGANSSLTLEEHVGLA